MKRIFLLFIIVSSAINLTAQTEKGTFMIEGGINLAGNLKEGFEISFGNSDYFAQDYATKAEKYYRSDQHMIFSVAPRFGYFLDKNLITGIDLKYWMNSIKYGKDDAPTYNRILYGIYARKYMGNHKITPFVECGTGFGLSTDISGLYSSPGGGLYTLTEKKNLFYLFGAAGASCSLTERLKINLFAKFQHTREKFSNKSNFSASQNKTLNFDTALIVSFSYFFRKKEKI